MGDPRLNSVHLDASRRQDFRRAREALLHSRGTDTVYAERKRDEAEDGNTVINNRAGAPGHLDCWLVDREYIYPLKSGVNTMGRSADNDVVVEDLFVSRRHAAILMHHDRSCVLHDTASKNGTFLNGTKISGPTTLKPGDEIRICNRQFVFLTKNGHHDDAPAEARGGPTRTIAG